MEEDDMGLHYIGNLLQEDEALDGGGGGGVGSGKKKKSGEPNATKYPVVAPVKPLMGSSASAGHTFWPEPPPPYSPPLYPGGGAGDYAKLFSPPTTASREQVHSAYKAALCAADRVESLMNARKAAVGARLPPPLPQPQPPQKLSAVRTAFVPAPAVRYKAEAPRTVAPVRIPGLNPVEASKPPPPPPCSGRVGAAVKRQEATGPKRSAKAPPPPGRLAAKQAAATLAKSTSSSNLLKLDSAKARFAVLNKIGSHSELDYGGKSGGGRQRRTHSMADAYHGIEKFASEKSAEGDGGGVKRSADAKAPLASAKCQGGTAVLGLLLQMLLSLLHLSAGGSDDESEQGEKLAGGQHSTQQQRNGGKARKRTANRRREDVGAPQYYIAMCLTSLLGALQSAALWVSHLAFDFVLLLMMAIGVALRALARSAMLSVANGWRSATRFGRELVHNVSETHRRSKVGIRPPLEKRGRKRKR